MPTLPSAKPTDIFALAKQAKEVAGGLQQPVFGTNGKPNFKRTAIIVLALFILASGFVLTYKVTTKPKVVKQAASQQAAQFEYPFNVDEVGFTGTAAKQKFLDNFKKAADEKDVQAKYKLLEDNFLILRGYYVSTQNSQYRIDLQKFKKYLQKSFPQEVSGKPSIYDIPCLDLLCGKPTVPGEITDLKAEIDANSSIGENMKEDIAQNFKAAGLTKDKTQQVNYYINALSALFSEYTRTKDAKTQASYEKLSDFIKTNYPQFSIPKEITI